jgi:ABC-type multidrug transport system fused ATPase/permease subunit
VDILDTALEVIDLRSFSNLWYWIALAVLWSSVSHWVLGVPHDMILRARRDGGQAQTDVEDLVRIYSNRVLNVVDQGAFVMVGIAAFWLSALLVLAFWYDVEFAQALVFLVAPMMLVVWVSVRACRRIQAEGAAGEALFRRLSIHRRVIQVIGMLSIAVTGFYGTWQNLSVSIIN